MAEKSTDCLSDVTAGGGPLYPNAGGRTMTDKALETQKLYREFLLLRFSLLFSIYFILIFNASADPITTPVDPAGTYLATDFFDSAGTPTNVPLSKLNFYSNLPISSQFVGLFANGGLRYGIYPSNVINNSPLGSVFSSNAGFLPSPLLINSGLITTIPSYYIGRSTDIPQDFFVQSGSYSDFAIAKVPKGASSLLFTVNDSHFEDNSSIDLNVTAFTLKDAVDK